jgi:isoquinoline 1-oxidoreductase subunit alpha
MITMRVNGEEHRFDGDLSMPLLWYLRDELGLTGTKYGCGISQCGACTVHLEGQATRACLATMQDVAGKTVVTIEGLSQAGDHPLQRAWLQHQVPQCGYCQSGQIMQAAALLREHCGADRRPDRRGHGWQHLPLRHLHAHPRCHQDRGRRGLTWQSFTTSAAASSSPRSA